MLDNWQRLERVIKWTGLSVNSFALTIGLKRSENLYQIKKGNNGISRDLAELIAAKYPSISRGWLLSGEGDMFLSSNQNASTGVPFYGMDVLEAIRLGNKRPEPTYLLNLPMFEECDLAALCLGTAMQPDIPPASVLMLKQVPLSALIPGETYAICSARFSGIRIIRQDEDPEKVVLWPRNTQDYDPITIEKAKLGKLFLVRGIIIKKNT